MRTHAPKKTSNYPTWSPDQALAWYRETIAPQVSKAERKRGEAAIRKVFR